MSLGFILLLEFFYLFDIFTIVVFGFTLGLWAVQSGILVIKVMLLRGSISWGCP